MLRHWRRARGLSQLELGLSAGVSARHLSFVETGRSRPGRQLLIRLASHLEIPPGEQNAILEAAGHARLYRERDWEDPELDQIREVFEFLLESHLPNSALVIDAGWNIRMANASHAAMLRWFLGAGSVDSRWSNLVRLTLHPQGLRPYIVNLAEVAAALLGRLERELREVPGDQRLRTLLAEARSYGTFSAPGAPAPANPLLIPIVFEKDGTRFRLISVLSTVLSAVDLTVRGLRLESFFPADPTSRETLAALTAGEEGLAPARGE